MHFAHAVVVGRLGLHFMLGQRITYIVLCIHRMAAAILFGLMMFAMLLSAGLAQNCMSGGERGPALPMFPDQFSTEIEANIVHFNLTLSITEYYDNINNRGRIDRGASN